jgi:AraC family transcriptional activator FtrA
MCARSITSCTRRSARARARLGTTLSVADLARHAHLSAATLHRRFRAELGTTPLAWLTAERVDLARRLIEQGAAPLEVDSDSRTA